MCGPDAPAIAALFAGSQTKAEVIDGPIGAASALKACYAAWSKGEIALLGIIRAPSHAMEGVDETLLKEWADSAGDRRAIRTHRAARPQARKLGR